MPKHQLQPVLFLCLALLSLPFQASAQEIQPTDPGGGGLR